ncbi:hypothetical protein M407DRAFT_34368 [Tulasnella calospora MUT 4182]|uniref:Anaphase-promoting complex subunit 5 domain-containing protein n=1 Tax=Tulasnella calospora MUT 4182 TaxID=1051891 RepID=A0A0C3L2P4_9AGAM|nr:hypothetical protein M407DRAFT_34368 [Tulasnella calospora MUT 4182]
MCKTTVTYLPRCTPTPRNADQQPQSPGLLENLGDLESWRGNPERSSAYLDEALRLYQKEADAKGIASVLRKQMVAAYRILDFVKLHAIATAAVEHCKTLNDTLGIAEGLFYLGYSIRMLGDSEKALPILCESLEIRRVHGDDADVIQCLERIGEIQRAIGLKQEALSTLGEAVEVTSRSGDGIGLALALHMVGVTHTERSDFVKASDALSEAITISRKFRLEGRLSVTLSSMGRLKMRLGDYPAAETLFQESIHIARHIRDRFTLAQGLEELGECLHKQSRPDEAAALLEEACLFWRGLSQPSSSKNVASSLVDLKSSQCDWGGALLWHDHIITVCRSQKEHSEVADHLEVADQLELKGEVLVKAQRYDEAALHFEAAMLTRMESMDSWPWPRRQLGRQLSAIPKTAMKWERRLPILCDIKKLQRRQPQLVTASLKFAIPIGHEES